MIDATLEVGDAFGVGDDLNAGLQSATGEIASACRADRNAGSSRG